MNSTDVWLIDVKDKESHSLSELLIETELERAATFRFANDCLCWSVSRGGLRLLLSRYLAEHPSSLEFVTDRRGKPHLVEGELEFSVSHSGSLAAYAFSSSQVGIDIEVIDERLDFSAIARRFFSEAENSALNELSHEVRRRAFFNCWVRKEALLKGVGLGLRLPLKSFDVTVGDVASLKASRTKVLDRSSWRIESIESGGEHTGALATPNFDAEVNVYWWNEAHKYDH